MLGLFVASCRGRLWGVSWRLFNHVFLLQAWLVLAIPLPLPLDPAGIGVLLLLGPVARDSCTSVGTVGFAESVRVMYLVLPVCACVQDEIVSDEGSKRSSQS
jgi:hypothetical protein